MSDNAPFPQSTSLLDPAFTSTSSSSLLPPTNSPSDLSIPLSTTSLQSSSAAGVMPPANLSDLLPTSGLVGLGNLAGQQTQTGIINGSGSYTDYSFNLTTPANLNLSLTGTGGDVDLYLYRVTNGQFSLVQSSAYDGNNESLSLNNLAAGTYYAEVSQYGTTSTAYTLTLTSDTAGNSLSTARNLGFVSNSTTTAKDFVGTSDPQDFYRFQLTGLQNNLSISLKDLTADADVYLIQDANNNGVIDPGETIAYSVNGGTAAESLNLQGLSGGNYYIKVEQYSGDTNFTLGLTATSSNTIPVLPTVALPLNPIDLGVLQGRTSDTRSVTSFINPDNFYRFDLTATSDVNLSLNGIGGDADLYLARDFNGDGQISSNELIRYGAIDGNQEFIRATGLTAGTYYAIVDQYGTGTTNYTLTMTADAAGNTFKDARNLGPITSGTSTTVKDFVGTQDGDDFYRVQLTGSSTNLLVNLKNLTSDADIWLMQDTNNNGILDAADKTLGWSFNAGTTADTIYAQNLAAGTYYLRVTTGTGNVNTNYSLEVSALSGLDGNIFSRPIDLGAVETQRSLTGSFTNTDGMDLYHFNLNATTDLNLNLTGLTNTADLYLFRDTNNNGIFDAGDMVQRSLVANPTSGSLDVAGLAPGSYFIGVFEDGGNTAYTLNLTPDAAGDTLLSARNIGLLSSDRSFTNFLSPTQPDYYQFTLSSTSTVQLDLGWLGGLANGQNVSVDAALIQDFNGNGITDTGEVLSYAANNGVGGVSLNATLPAGTYYVRLRDIDSGNYNTLYKLNLSTTPA